MATLFINTFYEACGVYQYGIRLYECIKDLPNVFYCEANSYTDYTDALAKYSPTRVIFNYHFSPMHWLSQDNIVRTYATKSLGSEPLVSEPLIQNIGIIHESPESMFDVVLDPDPSKPNGVPRPLCYTIPTSITVQELEIFINYKKGPDVPIFGSFGFGFANKGFDKLIRLVNDQYDNAIIKLVIPLGKYCSEDQLIQTVNACHQVVRKPGIELLISNEFFENDDILYFLGSNTMNIFCYDTQYGRGISSVVDYAMSVDVPFGISDSYMFRHIYDDCICVYKKSIEYIRNQLPYIQECRQRYSKNNIQQMFKGFFDSTKATEFPNTKTTEFPLSNSQASQDLFVLLMTQYKRGGTFLEIGSNDPVKTNNSFLLESAYGWTGIMVEYDATFKDAYKSLRPGSKHVFQDARTVDYAGLIGSLGQETSVSLCTMDYLQIDLDVNNRSTLDTLEILDKTVFDTTKFAVVTFEHDIYTGDYFDTRAKSREIFGRRGYQLVCPDVAVFFNGARCEFEDWYVHPDLVTNVKSLDKSFYHDEIVNGFRDNFVVSTAL